MDLEKILLRAALQAGVRPSAVEDVLRRGGERFVDPNGSAVSRAITVEEAVAFLEELRPGAPHLFVPSQGGGAAGSSTTSRSAEFDRTPYLSPGEFGKNLDKIRRGEPVR